MAQDAVSSSRRARWICRSPPARLDSEAESSGLARRSSIPDASCTAPSTASARTVRPARRASSATSRSRVSPSTSALASPSSVAIAHFATRTCRAAHPRVDVQSKPRSWATRRARSAALPARSHSPIRRRFLRLVGRRPTSGWGGPAASARRLARATGRQRVWGRPTTRESPPRPARRLTSRGCAAAPGRGRPRRAASRGRRGGRLGPRRRSMPSTACPSRYRRGAARVQAPPPPDRSCPPPAGACRYGLVTEPLSNPSVCTGIFARPAAASLYGR